MSATETSIIAYDELIETGKVDSQMNRIYKEMSNHETITKNELAQILNMNINAVCGRIGDLQEAGLVFESNKRESKITRKINITFTTNKDLAIKKNNFLSEVELNNILKKITTKANEYQKKIIIDQCNKNIIGRKQTENHLLNEVWI